FQEPFAAFVDGRLETGPTWCWFSTGRDHGGGHMSEDKPAEENISLTDKVKLLPLTPGVYLMKDEQGRVLYVGKAKNLRNRASHYFSKAAAGDTRTSDLVKLIADIDFVEAESEVDALLMEARL